MRMLRKIISLCANMWDKKLGLQAKRVIGYCLITAGIAVVIYSGISTYQAKKSRTVDLRMENIGELTTQAAYYTNVQVLRNDRELWGITIPFTQSEYIYSYDGIIKAGIDFSKLTAIANEHTKTITVSFPGAYITSNEVNEESLVIYDEERNIFTPLKLEDIQATRQLMKDEAEVTAITNGILSEAEENAKRLIEHFLKSDPKHQDYQVVFDQN